MGDVPSANQPQGSFSTTTPSLGSQISKQPNPNTTEQHGLQDQYGYDPTTTTPEGGRSLFQSQLQQQFYPPFLNMRQNHPPSSPSNIAQTQLPSRNSALSMASLGAALPDTSYGQLYAEQHSLRFPSGVPSATPVYQLHQSSQFPTQASISQLSSPQYTVQYPQQYQGIYAAYQQAPVKIQKSSPSPSHQFIANQQNFVAPGPSQPVSPYYYQTIAGQFPSHGQSQTYQTSRPSPYSVQYGNRGSILLDGGHVNQSQSSNEYPGIVGWQSFGHQAQIFSPRWPLKNYLQILTRLVYLALSSRQNSIPRGPPRKPKQSGHALWVGNLPPGATVIDLKDHFSREATNDILSVFLISKSNCAFANYKAEESCAAAMNRFHDSRFQGVRLVCRLRRNSVNAAQGIPAGPATLSTPQPAVVKSPDIREEGEAQTAEKEIEEDSAVSSTGDKYFVLKSLTVEDLELSVRNGIWATQSHNEEALNQAYETADVVYLIFSANKSGEYFGYARMISAINNDPAAAIEFAPKAQAVEDPDLPKAIPTTPTEWAPKGRIIDDSARGTIFWEAESEEAEGTGESDENHSDNSDHEADDINAKAWGKPFKVEWLSTNRLPFYRTRGLRNPWNSNREVKIARDGTELETFIGRRLIAMFHREPNNVAPAMTRMMGGYPQMGSY